MAEFIKVARVSDIPPGQIRGFEVGYERIVIGHTENGFFAVTDECSHDAAPISDGELRGKNLVCPRHGAMFNIENGAVTGPPAVIGIDCFEVKVDGEEIYVRLDESVD